MDTNDSTRFSAPTALVAEDPKTSQQAPADATRTKAFALIVGIDQYERKAIPPLQGCVSDGEDFRQFLQDSLAVPPDHILILYNESATRQNILSAFENHLIHNERIEKDDLIFFYYAGHGGRMAAPPGWKCEDNKIETICPYDESVSPTAPVSTEQTIRGAQQVQSPSPGSTVSCIPDHKFGQLMRRLASSKGDNIVAIFDCCHSGGMARDSSSSLATPRSLPDNLWRPPLSEDDWKESYKARFGDVRGAQMVIPSSFSYSGLKSHVLLAACQPNQVAHEHRLTVPTSSSGQSSRGLFTLHLLHCLRKAVEEKSSLLTYASLVRGLYRHEISPWVLGNPEDNPGPLTKQHPHIEGYNQHRFLFKTTALGTTQDSFALIYDAIKSQLYVNAGTLYGLQNGAKLICTHPDNDQMFPGGHIELVVSVAKPLRSILTLNTPTSISLKRLDTLTAIVVAWSKESMSLKVNGLASLPEDDGHWQTPFHFTQTENPGDADISFTRRETSREYEATRHDPLTAHFSSPKFAIAISSNPDMFLNHVAKFNFHLYRSHQSPNVAKELPVKLHLHRLRESPDNTILETVLVPTEPKTDLLDDKQKSVKVHTMRGDPPTAYHWSLGMNKIKEVDIDDLTSFYGLELVNESKYDLFAYVFYFDPNDYSITQWYLPPKVVGGNAPLKKSGNLEVGYGNIQESIQLSIADGVKKESGFIKVFFSTSYVDMHGLEQQGYDGQAGRGASMTKVDGDGGWSSLMCVLTCVASTAAEEQTCSCGLEEL